MHPYRTNAIPANAIYYCYLCDTHKPYAKSMQHPSGVGSIYVCQDCIDNFIVNSFDWDNIHITKQTVRVLADFIKPQNALRLIFDSRPNSNKILLSWK